MSTIVKTQAELDTVDTRADQGNIMNTSRFESWPWCLLFGVLTAAVLYALVLGVLAVSGT